MFIVCCPLLDVQRRTCGSMSAVHFDISKQWKQLHQMCMLFASPAMSCKFVQKDFQR